MSSGGSGEQFRYKRINILIKIAVRGNGMSIYRRVLWGNMAEKKISMMMKEDARKCFREVVRWVNGCVNLLKNEEVPCDPIT
jgi:hypothetical protein